MNDVVNPLNTSHYIDETTNRLLDRSRTKPNDILVTIAGTIGRIGYVPNNAPEMNMNQAVAVIRTKPKLLNYLYLFYLLQTKELQNQMSCARVTGTITNISLTTIKNLDIYCLSINEQIQIAEKLDAIRKLRELNNRQVSKINKLHESLINKEIKLKDYSKAKLSEITKPQEFTNPEKSPNDEYQYIDISAIDSENLVVDFNRIRQFKGKDAPSRARKKIATGDVLFSTVRPNLKRMAKIDFPTYNSLASTGFTVLRPDISKINPDYMGTITCSGIVTEQVLPQMKGAAYPAVSDNDVFNAEIPLPERKKQDEIAEKFTTVQEYKKNLIKQKECIKEIFESTLNKFMNPD